jgi:hypothetical protein
METITTTQAVVVEVDTPPVMVEVMAVLVVAVAAQQIQEPLALVVAQQEIAVKQEALREGAQTCLPQAQTLVEAAVRGTLL